MLLLTQSTLDIISAVGDHQIKVILKDSMRKLVVSYSLHRVTSFPLPHTLAHLSSAAGAVCLQAVLSKGRHMCCKSSCVCSRLCRCLHLYPLPFRACSFEITRTQSWCGMGPHSIIQYSYTIDGICALNMIAGSCLTTIYRI